MPPKPMGQLGLNWLTTAENQREKPIRKFSIDPTSSIWTSTADPFFADPISETLALVYCWHQLDQKICRKIYQQIRSSHLQLGKKKEPKPKLFGPDIFGWGGGLPRERVGAKKFDTSLETREIKLFGRDIPRFCRDVPEVPEKFEKKMFVFNSRPLKNDGEIWLSFSVLQLWVCGIHSVVFPNGVQIFLYMKESEQWQKKGTMKSWMIRSRRRGKVHSWRRLQSMDAGTLLATLRIWSRGSRAEMHPRCAPSPTLCFVKSVSFEKMARIDKKRPPWHSANPYAGNSRERNSGEFFRSHVRKTQRNFGEQFCRFSPFNFQEIGRDYHQSFAQPDFGAE